MEIRPANPSDLEAVAKIEKTSILQPWSMRCFAEALQSPNVIFLVAEEEDAEAEQNRTVVGYCVLYIASDEGEIPSIAVKKEFRRRGIAKKLLLDAAKHAGEKGVKTIFLEVRKSNLTAKGLYEDVGFQTDGERSRFYQNPVEDAWVMHWELDKR